MPQKPGTSMVIVHRILYETVGSAITLRFGGNVDEEGQGGESLVAG